MSFIACSTSFLASVQSVITRSSLSSSEMKPWSHWSSISSTMALVALEYLLFLLGHDDVVLADGDAGPGGRVEPDPLQGVEELANQLRRVVVHVLGHEGLDLTLLQRVVDVG